MEAVLDPPKSANKTFKPAHKTFIDTYLVTKNASKSAVAAGFNPSTAGQYGYQLLHNPRIAAEIKRRLAIEDRQLEEVKARQHKLAFSKEDFICEAMDNYKGSTEPRDKARFLELAGKAQGYLSNDVNVNLNLGMFNNAASELATIQSGHAAIRAELASPSQELNAPISQQLGAPVIQCNTASQGIEAK